eukprot:scaffold8413_cov135-Isochrysis_galbana.AAC.3
MQALGVIRTQTLAGIILRKALHHGITHACLVLHIRARRQATEHCVPIVDTGGAIERVVHILTNVRSEAWELRQTGEGIRVSQAKQVTCETGEVKVRSGPGGITLRLRALLRWRSRIGDGKVLSPASWTAAPSKS